MKEIKYFCDRCKKEIDFWYYTILIKRNGNHYPELDIEICKDCYDDIMNFIYKRGEYK